MEPTTSSAVAALASAEMPADLIAWVSDPEGKDAYPIVTYTWMLFYKKYDNQAKAKAIRAMIDYGLTEGQKESEGAGLRSFASRRCHQGKSGGRNYFVNNVLARSKDRCRQFYGNRIERSEGSRGSGRLEPRANLAAADPGPTNGVTPLSAACASPSLHSRSC